MRRNEKLPDSGGLYPEHDRLWAEKERKDVVAAFLLWLDSEAGGPFNVCAWDAEGWRRCSDWERAEIIARFLGINAEQFAAEKHQMLEDLHQLRRQERR